MKKIYAITLFLSFAFFGYAQLDTSFQKITTEEGNFEMQQIVDAKKHLLHLMQDEKSLWKIGFESVSLPINEELLFEFPIANGVFINYEHRIKTGFSINGRLSYSRAVFSTLSQEVYTDFLFKNFGFQRFSFEIEPRWYFLKNRAIKLGKSGNNLSGLYISNITGIQRWQRPGFSRSFDYDASPIKGDFQYSLLGLGWQRRFGKRGFIHAQIGAGIRHNEQINLSAYEPPPVPISGIVLEQLPEWHPIVIYKLGVGVALGKIENTKVQQTILAYHQEDASIWKIDLLPILLSSSEIWQKTSKISIGYEQGIKQSPFSINANLIYLHPSGEGETRTSYIDLQLSPRLYYNLKSRIRKGKTAYNLSAEYFSIRSQWVRDFGEAFHNKDFSLAFLWGIQRRLFKCMFVNYEFGYKTGFRPYGFNKYIVSDLKIGLAF